MNLYFGIIDLFSILNFPSFDTWLVVDGVGESTPESRDDSRAASNDQLGKFSN